VQPPHQTPEIKETVERVHEVFDQHSAVSIAMFVGHAGGKSIAELARQVSDQKSRKGHVNRVKKEIERRVKSVQEDLEDVLLDAA